MAHRQRLVIVVPTRNRARLALSAVASVLNEAVPTVEVMVSDNSTDEAESRTLERGLETMASERAHLVRPPGPLPMTAHWQWALDEALRRHDPSHVGVLQDRALFRSGQLPAIAQIVEDHPEIVMSWGNDIVDDAFTPVKLARYASTGKTYLLSSGELSRQVSRGVFPMALPRMLNSSVPVDVIERVRSRYGAVFASISPDFYFALRCLQTVGAVGYYDQAALISYGLDRSNGASFARGDQSADSQDFIRDLGDEPMNWASPAPDLAVFGNPIFHEYALATREPDADLPPIDRGRYLALMARGTKMLGDEHTRAAMRQILREEGWTGPRRLLHLSRLATDQLPQLLHPVAFARRALLRARPPRGLVFDSSAEALAHANRHPPPRALTSAALRLSLRDRPWRRTVRRLDAAATQVPGRIVANRLTTSGQSRRSASR